jgi:hypothetical protein
MAAIFFCVEIFTNNNNNNNNWSHIPLGGGSPISGKKLQFFWL